jgi:formylglycine-generating enzyme required for sulfatase activity
MVLKNDALEAEAERDWELAEQLWVRVLAVSPADQQAIKAIKRIARQVDIEPPPRRETPSSSTSSRDVQPIPVPPSPPTVPTFQFEVVTVDAEGREVNRRSREAQYFTEDLGRGHQLELVAIPGGKFQMGSPDDEERRDDDEIPQHWVTVKPFLLGKYAVTQAQWQAVAALPPVNIDLDSDPAVFKGANRPVERVNWHEAVEFCARLSQKTGREYRLPSEAEWEYACRAGTTTPFHFGPTLTTNLANYNGNYVYGSGPKGVYREQTTDVGSFPPNAFGIYDMHGNVWEWCLDHWHDNYKGAPTDGSAWIEGGDSNRRLLRGGSWDSNPRSCRSANRNRDNPDYRFNDIGFRIVCGSAWTL